MTDQLLKDYFFPSHHLTLIKKMAQRDIWAHYRGSIIGLSWVLLTPILMLSVYVFAFRVAFNARWPGAENSTIEFALQVYTGLIIYNLFAQSVSRAPGLIIEHTTFVKKVLFPIQSLAWSTVLTNAFHAVFSIVVLLAVSVITGHSMSIALIALPITLGPIIPLLLGLVWIVSATGVYFRDLNQIISLAVTLLIFLSSVFYPFDSLPPEWQPWLMLNPLSSILEQSREVILSGNWPDWPVIVKSWVAGLFMALLGAIWFRQLRKGFADVL